MSFLKKILNKKTIKEQRAEQLQAIAIIGSKAFGYDNKVTLDDCKEVIDKEYNKFDSAKVGDDLYEMTTAYGTTLAKETKINDTQVFHEINRINTKEAINSVSSESLIPVVNEMVRCHVVPKAYLVPLRKFINEMDNETKNLVVRNAIELAGTLESNYIDVINHLVHGISFRAFEAGYVKYNYTAGGMPHYSAKKRWENMNISCLDKYMREVKNSLNKNNKYECGEERYY